MPGRLSAHSRQTTEVGDIYFIANAHWEEHTFELPDLSEHCWCRVIDTMQMPPHDIADLGTEAALTEQRRYVVGPGSVVVLMGKVWEQSRDIAIYEKGCVHGQRQTYPDRRR